MEQRLKAINVKLDELHDSYDSEQVEEIFFRMVRNGTLDRESSETEGKAEHSTRNAENSQKGEEQV